MKYAVIGCGRISPKHIEVAKNNNLDFVAMCIVVLEVIQKKNRKVVIIKIAFTHPYLEAKNLGVVLVFFSIGSYGLIEGMTNVYPNYF